MNLVLSMDMATLNISMATYFRPPMVFMDMNVQTCVTRLIRDWD